MGGNAAANAQDPADAEAAQNPAELGPDGLAPANVHVAGNHDEAELDDDEDDDDDEGEDDDEEEEDDEGREEDAADANEGGQGRRAFFGNIIFNVFVLNTCCSAVAPLLFLDR